MTARTLEALRHDPARLYAFLRAMPKGGDLHSHLSGAIYAESFLRWAADDGACVTLATLTLVPPPCDGPAGRPAASAVQADANLRSRVIDAFSMRNYKPAVENGHDRFFATFGRFGLASDEHMGDMLAEVSHRAAEGQVRYLELMHTAGGGSVGAIGRSVGWDDDWGHMRQRVLDAGLRDTLRAALRQLDHAEAARDTDLECGTAGADPGCGVTVRYLYQVLRAFPREQVFAQILAGFELTRMDPRFVGFNLVQPEDDRVAMRDYDLHMRIIGFLKTLYPDVPVSLHAGELAEGLVPPEGLRFHIREAVEVAGAKRIGHGVDVLHEDDPDGLLLEMARRRVMVEINLTSNDVILGITGRDHPLSTYLAYGVPVALSTDDEGVSRSEMTGEYMRAVLDQEVGYLTLKAMARNSLEYAFVEGESVWRDLDTLAPVPACAPETGGWAGDACATFAAGSTKAKLQVGLERDLGAFEARVAAGNGPVLIPGSN
ncbi:MAG: adenosine deaminase [Gemmatimonadota bacterium]